MSGASWGCFPQTGVGSKAFLSSGYPIIPEVVTATALHSLMCPSCPHAWDMQGLLLLPLPLLGGVGCILHLRQQEGLCQALPLPES